MKALSVHGLGGGFAYGVQQSGWQLHGMAETAFASKIRRLNLTIPETNVKELEPKLDEHVELIFGCPPCAGFSVAGSGLAQHDNPTHAINDGIRDWFRWVSWNQPEIAVLESVPRTFFSEAGQELWRPLASEHLDGYGINLVSYDNQQVGIPQKRVRTLLWAMKGGVPNVELDRGFAPSSASLALDDLGAPTEGWEVDLAGWGHVARPINPTPPRPDWIMTFVPWGGNARKEAENAFIWRELEAAGRSRPSFLWRRLHANRPSPVLLADAAERVAHYVGDEKGAGIQLRYLSGREIARLMGYPDDFKLGGHLRRDVGPALCQAVSPRVGSWVGTEAGRLLEETAPFCGPVHQVTYTDLSSRLAVGPTRPA